MTRFSMTKLVGASLALTIGLAAPANAAEDAGVQALVSISQPTHAALLHLRGLVGQGTAYIKLKEGCWSMPVRFAAGDFDGRSTPSLPQGPIHLKINKPETVQALYERQDIVSDSLSVGPTADVTILSGALSNKTGFVVNPGTGLLDDIFGVTQTDIDCSVYAEKAKPR